MLYSYVVRVDGGFAPNPDNGFLTLACCKPRIRKRAAVGDWVLGTHRTGVNPRAVCFLGRVSEVVDFHTYGTDPMYAAKLPTASNNGDAIYTRDTSGRFIQRRNRNHHREHVEHDTSADRVLVFREFWYFGRTAVEIPEKLATALVKRGPGQKNIQDQALIDEIVSYLSAWPPGKNGVPRDLRQARHTASLNCGSRAC